MQLILTIKLKYYKNVNNQFLNLYNDLRQVKICILFQYNLIELIDNSYFLITIFT